MGKSLAISSGGLGFEQLMKLLVSTPKEKIERVQKNEKRRKNGLKSKPPRKH